MNLAFYLLLSAQEPIYLDDLNDLEPPPVEEIYEEPVEEEIG